MCSDIYNDATCTVKYDVNQKTLGRLTEEINNLEKDLEEAQNNFTHILLESIATINSLRLKCRLSVDSALSDKDPSLNLSKQRDYVSSKKVGTCRQSHILQKELENSIVKSGWFTKISLMKLSNLLAQHNLLFLPFYELREYYNQLFGKREQYIADVQPTSLKLSYAEALKYIKEISDESEETKERILNLTEDQRSRNSMLLDHSHFIKVEYKSLP